MKPFHKLIITVLFLSSLNLAKGQNVPEVWRQHEIKEKHNVLSSEFARVFKGEYQAIIGIKGDTIIEAKYKYINYDTLGFFILADKNYRTGVIDKKGQPFIPLVYDQIQILRDGFQAYKDNDLVFFNFDGKEEKHPIYNKYQIRSSNANLSVASLDGQYWGAMDGNGT